MRGAARKGRPYRDLRYLVVDNTPERDPRTEAITRAVGGTYLHRPDLSGTSKPRDAVFRYAKTPWVMCIDSHVFLEPGAVLAALGYCAARPDSKDMIQGPIVWDDGNVGATHWDQPAAPGLWGAWAKDKRAEGSEPFDYEAAVKALLAKKDYDESKWCDLVAAIPEPREPFEIPMMGLGLWMMRKDAWPGFNPLFTGFGGEEGYIHEVVRQRGGKALCLPALRWRHKFRDTSGWHNNPPPPYPASLDDHVWNLLVGHREVGIDAVRQIYDHFGRRTSKESWGKLVADAERAQPFGGPRPEAKRQRILAVWYSDNHAPLNLTMHSLSTAVAASKQALRHDVTVSACSWETGNFGILPGMGPPVINGRYAGERRRGYDTIVNQIKQAVAAASQKGEEYDAVCFMEHDVLYPPNYFDRIGDALARNPSAPVVSNLDYIGLNSTGWQAVKERHEPLHQLTLRWDVFRQNLARAEGEAGTGQPVILEPEHGGERRSWVRLPRRRGMCRCRASTSTTSTAGSPVMGTCATTPAGTRSTTPTGAKLKRGGRGR